MDEDALKKYRQAGKITSETLKWGAKLIKPGVKYSEVADKIEAKIKDAGAEMAFPTNISVQDIAAHYTPKPKDDSVFGEDDVVKLDIGAHIDGYIADTAVTVDLSGEHSKMLEANEQALEEAMNVVKAGVSVREIGKVVQKTIEDAGYHPIENLSGHQLEQYDLHAGLSIPNIDVPYDWVLEEGMALAIEPFATDGAGHVIESRGAMIYSVLEEKPVRMREARTLMKAVAEREGLPFASRWYADKVNPLRLRLVLDQLTQADILRAYPPLHDRGQGIVTQFEHTLIVEEDGCEITTKR